MIAEGANDPAVAEVGANIVEVRRRPRKATGGMNQLHRVMQIGIGRDSFVFRVVVHA